MTNVTGFLWVFVFARMCVRSCLRAITHAGSNAEIQESQGDDSDHASLFHEAGLLGLLQTSVRRMENVAGVVLLLEALQDAYPNAAIPAKLLPIPQAFCVRF